MTDSVYAYEHHCRHNLKLYLKQMWRQRYRHRNIISIKSNVLLKLKQELVYFIRAKTVCGEHKKIQLSSIASKRYKRFMHGISGI